MRAKTILLVAAFGLILSPLAASAKGGDRHAPRRQEAHRAQPGAHASQNPAQRGHRRDEGRDRGKHHRDHGNDEGAHAGNRGDDDDFRHERRRDRDHVRRNADHPHGGPPGHRMKRGRGHEKHAGYDSDHPHGGPPGHRRHGDAGNPDTTQRVLDAVLGN